MTAIHPSKAGLVDPISDRLNNRLRRASVAMMHDMAARLAQSTGLRPHEGEILVLIGYNTGVTQSDIGRMLGIKRANMVPLIIELTAKGLIQREPTDGRSFSLSLSASGEAARAQAEAAMAANEHELTAFLGEADIAGLKSALAQIARHFGESAHHH